MGKEKTIISGDENKEIALWGILLVIFVLVLVISFSIIDGFWK